MPVEKYNNIEIIYPEKLPKEGDILEINSELYFNIPILWPLPPEWFVKIEKVCDEIKKKLEEKLGLLLEEIERKYEWIKEWYGVIGIKLFLKYKVKEIKQLITGIPWYIIAIAIVGIVSFILGVLIAKGKIEINLKPILKPIGVSLGIVIAILILGITAPLWVAGIKKAIKGKV